jgi:adenine-specific DNA-methyltransferase
MGSLQRKAGALNANEYLESLPLEDRRGAGQVYTPAHLVDFTLAQAGYEARASVEDAALLDPSCGAGAFLERAVLVLAERFAKLGTDLKTAAGHRRFVSAVEANLYGIDVDAHACDLARAVVRRRVLELSPGRLGLGFFRSNIVVADFLVGTDVEALPPVCARSLRFVVGNPPYVSATRITSSYKMELRSRFHSAGGRLDLYTVFIERALMLLADGGRLALVTPDKFLASQSGRGLRGFILQVSAVRSIAKFRSHKVFEDAATVPCVTVLERGGRPRDVAVLACAEKPTVSGRVRVLERSAVPHGGLSSAPWHVTSPGLHAFARRLVERHPTLAQLTVRVSAGPATGRDGLFVFPAGSQPGIEPELLRPVVRGRDVLAFRIANPELDMLVPYVFDAAGNSTLIDLSRYPGARRYLEKHRADLEARHCVRVWRKRWYDLHDQVLWDLAKQTKLLVPDVANSNRFAVDHGTFLPLHSVYYVLPKPGVDVDFLAAVLNSRVASFLVKLFSPVVKDGFNRYRQQFLLTLPVPLASSEQVSAIADAARAGRAEDADRRVQQLFRLSTEESGLLRAGPQHRAVP